MSDELLRLADRCEAASGPDRALDIDIASAVGLVPDTHERASSHGTLLPYFWHKTNSRGALYQPEHFTASLDAAMALVPQGWFGRVEPRFYSDDGEVRWRGYAIKPDWSRWTPHDDWFDVVGEEPTITASKPALALTAAALRARASRLRMEVE